MTQQTTQKQNVTNNIAITERFEFRDIHANEADRAVAIEQICFPPHEACSEKSTGEIAGFLNGVATDEEIFRDEFFTDISQHKPDGKNVMLLGLDVLPQYRGQGLAREIVSQYSKREKANQRNLLILTCLPEKVAMYEKMGLIDKGISGSSWGGEEWHEMTLTL